MASWLFDTDNETWGTANGMTWDSADGEPLSGCMSGLYGPSGAIPNSTAITGLSIAVTAGDNVSMHVKWAGTIGFADQAFEAKLFLTIGSQSDRITVSYGPVTGVVDSGWITATGTAHNSGTLTAVTVIFSINSALEEPLLKVFLDSVYAVETEPPVGPFGSTELRWLGMAADFTNFYLTGAGNGGILGFKTYNLFTLGSLSEDTVFGTASFTDIDAGLRGIYPAARPTADKIAYAYGRDGSAVHVRYNDMNGTLGWVNIGPGTATWGTAKIAVALLPDALVPDDVIVVFSDNDVYRTIAGTAPWVKQGDATTNVRTAARVMPASNQLLLAGTAAGTLLFTQNLGVSYASGGTAAGTINAIEVSR